MIIAVNSILFQFDQNGPRPSLQRLMESAAALDPGHQFIFIHPSPPQQDIAPNIKWVKAGPRPGGRIMLSLWYDHLLSAAVKKYHAEILLSTDLLSKGIKISQWLVLEDPGFRKNEWIDNTHARLAKKRIGSSIRSADKIITSSEYNSIAIAEKYPDAKEKRIVIKPGTISDRAHERIDKQLIKNQYTEGKEYFLFIADEASQHHAMNVLKAYSFFKKRQKSNVQLVIAGSVTDPTFNKQIGSYKYRDEVVSVDPASNAEAEALLRSAYAIVYPADHEGTGLNAWEPVSWPGTGTAVISGTNGVLKERFGNSALYADPANISELAEALMLVFKDEARRNELIRNGTGHSVGSGWAGAATALMDRILSRPVSKFS